MCNFFSISINFDWHPKRQRFIFYKKSYRWFFKHDKNHNNTAYEFFTQKGPLAVLPIPSNHKKKSTFIYSTKEKIDNIQIQKLIIKKVSSSHGNLIFNQSISKFSIKPHLTKNNKNFILANQLTEKFRKKMEEDQEY